MKFPYRHQRLHPVVDVDVVRCPAIPAAQYALAGHLLLVRRESAGQDVRLPGWTLERCLKSVSDQAESCGRIAVDGIELAVGHGVEGLDTRLTLCGKDGERPLHMCAVHAGNLGDDIVRHWLAGRQRGLRPVQVPPANEGAAVGPSG